MMKAGGSEFQDYPWSYIKFKARLDYMTPCPRRKKKGRKGWKGGEKCHIQSAERK